MGSPSGSLEAVNAYMLWLEATPWIERYAYFPLGVNGNESWWPSHWSLDMRLKDESGITPMGELFRDFQLQQVMIPLVVH